MMKLFNALRPGRGCKKYIACSDASQLEKFMADDVLTGTSDQTKINAMLTLMGAGTLFISGGTVFLSGGISYTVSGQTVEGSGVAATTLFATNNAGVNTTLIGSSFSFSTLRNLTIDGNKAQNTGRTSMLLFVLSGDYSIMESIHGKNSSGNGATFASAGGVCNNVSVVSSDYVGFLVTTTVTPSTKIIGCTATSNSGDGFYVAGSYITLDGCTASSNGTSGFNLPSGGSLNTLNGCVAISNTGTGFGINGTNIILSGCIANGSVVGYSLITANILLADCIAIGQTTYGVSIGGGLAVVRGLFQVGTTGSYGISISGGTGHQIEGCRVMSNGGHGINVDAANCQIVNNYVELNSTAANATYNQIALAAGADTCNVQGNTCRAGSSGNRAAYGINIAAGATDNLVTNNDLKTSGVTGSLLDGGTSTITAAGNRL